MVNCTVPTPPKSSNVALSQGAGPAGGVPFENSILKSNTTCVAEAEKAIAKGRKKIISNLDNRIFISLCGRLNTDRIRLKN
jgi:hypothetical protein